MSDEQPKKSSVTRWIKRISIGLTLCALIAIASLYGLKSWINHWSQTPLNAFMAQDITVKSGDNTRGILRHIRNNGSVKDTWPFKLLFVVQPSLGHIKVGHYHILAQPTPIELFSVLTSGIEKQFAITFIEGSTFNQWLDSLSQHPHIDFNQARVNAYINEFPASGVNEIKYTYARVEGQFFPDTYHFSANTQAIDILQRANKTLTSKLAVLWENRQPDVPLATKQEALVLASIIEKETGIASERDTIASAFTNRLNKRMRLQTDPTVIYGVADVYKGDITYKHLRDKNVYNTYIIKGLPPTPIAMPSEGAIKAALNPANTPYFYFVASGDGGHVFSTNLKDHNRALKRYLERKKPK
jgi:UPF0755 protein